MKRYKGMTYKQLTLQSNEIGKLYRRTKNKRIKDKLLMKLVNINEFIYLKTGVMMF